MKAFPVLQYVRKEAQECGPYGPIRNGDLNRPEFSGRKLHREGVEHGQVGPAPEPDDKSSDGEHDRSIHQIIVGDFCCMQLILLVGTVLNDIIP